MTTAASEPAFDVLVLGAGLRGLRAALTTRRTAPAQQLLVVDRAPQPGGSVRTVRTNGFVCEHGPIGFWRDELDATLSLLQHAPTPLAALPTARKGMVFDGERRAIDVAELPWSFRTGNEELVQACRRELGSTLRLGRAVTAITAATGDGFRVALAGDPPGEVRAHELGVTRVLLHARPLDGDATEVGRALALQLITAPPGTCLLHGGETTVLLPAPHGTGGRNQQLALSAAEALAAPDAPRTVVLAAGTDGRDGPTDAAGAVVTNDTWRSIAGAGIDPVAALERCDAYQALRAVDALLITGPTGTNVGDVVIGLRQE